MKGWMVHKYKIYSIYIAMEEAHLQAKLYIYSFFGLIPMQGIYEVFIRLLGEVRPDEF